MRTFNDSRQKHNFFTRRALTVSICLLTLVLVLVALLSYIFISNPTQGQVFVDMASNPAPAFGVVVNPGLKVVEVEPGSAAEQAGLHLGDKLEELDGKTLTSPSDAMQAGRSINLSGRSATLIITRNGQKITLKIQPSLPRGRPGGPTVTPVPQNFGYF